MYMYNNKQYYASRRILNASKSYINTKYIKTEINQVWGTMLCVLYITFCKQSKKASIENRHIYYTKNIGNKYQYELYKKQGMSLCIARYYYAYVKR